MKAMGRRACARRFSIAVPAALIATVLWTSPTRAQGPANHAESSSNAEPSVPAAAPEAKDPSAAAVTAPLSQVPESAADTVAAPAADESSSGIEEVMVTARRREESAQTVPVSVTALSGEALAERHIEDLTDLQYSVPGLSVTGSSGRPSAPVYGLRGIMPTESILGQDPTVVVYFSDVAMSPAQGSNLGFYDAASVQVLKGPQGTLFGRNTTGGAVLFTPRKPSTSFGGDISLGYGDYDHVEAEFGLDVPLSQSFRMRFSGRSLNQTGYQTNVAPGPLDGEKMGGQNTMDARISAVWNVATGVENYTILSWDDAKTSAQALVLQAVNPNSPAGAYNGQNGLPDIYAALARQQARDVDHVEQDTPSFDNTRVFGVFNTTTAQLADEITLKNIAGYRDVRNRALSDGDGSPIALVQAAGDPPQYTDMNHLSDELQLLGTSFDSHLNWQTGLFFYHEEGVQKSIGSVIPAINPDSPVVQWGQVNNSSYSIFGQGTYQFNPEWDVTLGARWTEDHRHLTAHNANGSGCTVQDANGNTLPDDQCARTVSKAFSQPTGTVTIDYKPRPGLLTYITSRLGYRSGGFNLRASENEEFQPFKAETVKDIEIGAKSDWTIGDWAARANVAVYHQWYDDIQRALTIYGTTGVGTAIENAANAEVTGAEIEAMIAPTKNMSLQLTYSYVDPEYKKWLQPAQDPTQPPTDLSGTAFGNTPKHSGSATLSYSLPLDRNLGKLNFLSTVSVRSLTWLNGFNTIVDTRAVPQDEQGVLKQKAFALLDFNAAWTGIMGTPLEVSAYVKNAADKRYSDGGVFLYSTIGFISKSYPIGRTFGLQTRYSF